MLNNSILYGSNDSTVTTTRNFVIGGKDGKVGTQDDPESSQYTDTETSGNERNFVIGGKDGKVGTQDDPNPSEYYSPTQDTDKQDENLLDHAAGSVDEAFGRQFDDAPGGGIADEAAGVADHAAGSTDEAVGRQFDNKKGGGFGDMATGLLSKYKYWIAGIGGIALLGVGYPYIQTLSGVTGK